ncbi:OmpH family outer membrane protein [Flavobacterium aquiphilum]|uniref:OmpH family outer membrane protein n=1 Tax=Flavobacterium aquiphilum TaxID=3003261 RepID=UPI002481539C|nr:OmpH family outer membrane protein [Flavobacterium aquiphilum]
MKNPPMLVAVAAVVLSVLAIYYAKSSSQLVYVDVNKLITGYEKTKVAKAEFDKKANLMRSNVDSLVANWQKELKNYEKERTTFSPKELKLKQELLTNKQQQINGYQEAIQKKIQEEDKRVTQTVINDINDYIKEYGKDHNYKIIFGASGGGNIMYADESTDLTEEVLKGLNAEYGEK